MRDDDALRGSGGAGGVDDIGGVVRVEGERRRGRRACGDGGGVGVEQHDSGGVLGRQNAGEGRLGDEHAGARIGEHEGEPLGRIARVERQIGAARLENAEQANHHGRRAGDAQADHRFRADAPPPQMMRQPVGARLEFAIGEALRLAHHRHRVRPARRLRGHQLRQACRGDRARGRVPVAQNGAALVGAQNVERPDRPLGIRSRRQQPQKSILVVCEIGLFIANGIGVEVDPNRTTIGAVVNGYCEVIDRSEREIIGDGFAVRETEAVVEGHDIDREREHRSAVFQRASIPSQIPKWKALAPQSSAHLQRGPPYDVGDRQAGMQRQAQRQHIREHAGNASRDPGTGCGGQPDNQVSFANESVQKNRRRRGDDLRNGCPGPARDRVKIRRAFIL